MYSETEGSYLHTVGPKVTRLVFPWSAGKGSQGARDHTREVASVNKGRKSLEYGSLPPNNQHPQPPIVNMVANIQALFYMGY